MNTRSTTTDLDRTALLCEYEVLGSRSHHLPQGTPRMKEIEALLDMTREQIVREGDTIKFPPESSLGHYLPLSTPCITA